MASEKQKSIAEAFSIHCRDLHNADFEVCKNPVCRQAYALEQEMQRAEETAMCESTPPTLNGLAQRIRRMTEQVRRETARLLNAE